ncbi:adenylate/guanylate cyclase domain-containing protein [Dechloromonas sp. A34]|uniref:adenylate/guanylate cyclase domain-containing protein n=1 Tax=Dechloromonas sp. A34 TaxID=447588 RepID=UPI002248CCEB|nr:adenylate/guanylate cyclase domain-containing protein [Dechloromonas sp. A34]
MGTSEGALAVLCADIARSARLAPELEHSEALYTVQRCEKRIRRAVESHGGRLVERSGNKLMAFFANDAEALQSAIEMQHRIAELPPHSGHPMGVRVGVCTGHLVREQCYFPGAGENPAASLSAVATPGHILLSVPKRATLFPWLQLAANSVPDLLLNCGQRRLGVFQLDGQQPAPIALRLALAEPGDGAGRLCVRHNNVEMVLDETQPLTRIGRHPDCDLVIRDARCSRDHGTIERRLDRFVFVDRSTNGTFISLEGKAEVHIHRRELALIGRGVLSLGAPASASGVEQVHFESVGLLR